MKSHITILAALMLAIVATTALADDAEQMQEEQQACGTDAYTFCGDAIPDQNRIAACLKKHWSEISPECRTAMNNHGRSRGRHKSRSN